MGKITVEEIDHIKGTFKEMDKDGSVTISRLSFLHFQSQKVDLFFIS